MEEILSYRINTNERHLKELDELSLIKNKTAEVKVIFLLI